tara:strand:- start:202 stop:399 length:198 start_codon:yes stop_codon:yes gene_type:complete
MANKKEENKIKYYGKKNISDSIEKQLLELKAMGFNIQGVINKDDPSGRKEGLDAVFKSLKDDTKK